MKITKGRLLEVINAVLDRADDFADYCEKQDHGYSYTSKELFEAAEILETLMNEKPIEVTEGERNVAP